jgi:phosphoserine phosphatase
MDCVIILIAGINRSLFPEIMDKITPIFENYDVQSSHSHIIVPEKVVEIPIHYTGNLQELQNILAEILMDNEIDVAVLPKNRPPIKLLIADMDSTMIYQECIDELADYAGKKQQVSEITRRAMRGELEFEESLIKRVECLRGLHISVLKECFEHRIKMMSGASDLITHLRKNDVYCALVSGGFTFFAQLVAKQLNFNTYRANILMAYDDVLTGQVEMPILGRAAKKQALMTFIKEKNISADMTMAVGDGAGLGIAYHAKPAVSSAARIAIRFADLSALKYLLKKN